MEAIIFMGIQGSGKSTFYKTHFFNSHMRISMDLLNTRNKESRYFQLSLELQQRIVIDNTNPTIDDRLRYIPDLKKKKYKIIGYYFHSKPAEAIKRNNHRTGKGQIPERGILTTYKKLKLPTLEEGFDEIYQIEIVNNEFSIVKIND